MIRATDQRSPEPLRGGGFTLCLSQSIVDELLRALREGFEWSEEDLAEALDPVLALAEIEEPQRAVMASRDPNDDHVLACAIEARAEVLVSGDYDLPSLGVFESLRILTPREFLKLLDAS